MTRRIGVFAFDDGIGIDVVGPFEAFVLANHVAGTRSPPYAVELIAASLRPLRLGSGLVLQPQRRFADVRGGLDTLLVSGGLGWPQAATPALCGWLRRMSTRVRRIGSICVGAFLLAEAGLLDGRRAATHWAHAAALAARHPKVKVDADAIFVRDGHVYSSAGMTSGMDLALALIEDDLGGRVALSVAQQMVLFLKRPGGQSQFSAHLDAQAVTGGRLGDLPGFIVEHPTADLRIEALARRAALSPRHFARLFREELGATPARFVERARVEAARRALEESALPIKAVAARAGFGSIDGLRRAFLRHLKITPNDYRARFRQRRVGGSAAMAGSAA